MWRYLWLEEHHENVNIVFNDSSCQAVYKKRRTLNARLRSWDQPGMGRKEETSGSDSEEGSFLARGTGDAEVLWASISNSCSLSRIWHIVAFSSRVGSAYEKGRPEAETSSDGIPVMPPQVARVADVTQSEAQQNGRSRKKFGVWEPENCVFHHCAFNRIFISSAFHH